MFAIVRSVFVERVRKGTDPSTSFVVVGVEVESRSAPVMVSEYVTVTWRVLFSTECTCVDVR